MITSLDGYIEGPNHELDWFDDGNPQFERYCEDMIDSVGLALYGRRAYEGMVPYWPAAERNARTPQERSFAERMNALPKVVLSKTLTAATWNHTRIVRDVDAIRALEREPGKAIVAWAGAGLVAALIEADLVDEFRLVVHPIALGGRDVASDTAIDTPVDPPPDAPPVELTSTVNFPSNLGSLCGAAFDRSMSTLWLHPCSGANIHSFSTAGVAGATVPRGGEATNDVDVTFTSEAIVLGTNTVPANTMIFVNGEVAGAELHLPTVAGSTPLASPYGSNHVVGGADHPQRDTVFLVQDQNGAEANTVAELDRVTGAVINSFSTLPFNVNFGDLEVCPETGNLFLVSSTETTLAELTPTGTVVGTYALPPTVTDLSGLALGLGEAWVTSTTGVVLRIDGVPCGL